MKKRAVFCSVLVAFGACVAADSFTPAVITVTAYDEDGYLVEQHFDADPMARFDIWPTGDGDANFDGKVDLADLNLVLANMGTEYR